MEWLLIPAIIFLGLDGKSSAATAAGTAYVKHTGTESAVDEWQRREFSEALRAQVGKAAFIAKTVAEQRITFEWRF